jgi:hypothetical protein
MSSTVASNAWAEIIHHRTDGILELRWLPAAMTDNAFKATLALFASEAEKLRPSSLLIDATDFRHDFAPGVMEWRDDAIIPRYGAAGVKKFAFLMPANVPNTMESGGKEVIDGPAIFPTAWFSVRQNALNWLEAG